MISRSAGEKKKRTEGRKGAGEDEEEKAFYLFLKE